MPENRLLCDNRLDLGLLACMSHPVILSPDLSGKRRGEESPFPILDCAVPGRCLPASDSESPGSRLEEGLEEL